MVKAFKKKEVKKIVKSKTKNRRKTAVNRYPINGVGAATTRAFGGTRTVGVEGLNALSPKHLTLPLNVGPYTIQRTTTIVKDSRTVMGFCFMRGVQHSVASAQVPDVTGTSFKEGWLPCCGFGGTADGDPATNTQFYGIPQLAQLGDSATLVPAALTVQIMNPGALATDGTKGILYIGASKTQFRLQDETRTWDTIGQDFVSYQTPRLCASSKLALRGVQVNAKPFNVQELMDFEKVLPLIDNNDFPTYKDVLEAWRSYGNSSGSTSLWQSRTVKGFAPIVIYNPDQVELQILVTCEWRVRFDFGHPASSTHSHHPASSTQTWDNVQRFVDKIGHGCEDIVENVARSGAAAVSSRLAAML